MKHTRRLVTIAYILLLVVLAAQFLWLRPWEEAEVTALVSSPPPINCFLLAIDGLEWSILRPMLARGELPGFAQVIERGVSGPLTSLPLEQSRSPVIWTTIATGRPPVEHGILDFLEPTGVPVRSTRRRVPAIWNIFSGLAKSVGILGYYVTWPVEPVNGYMYADIIGTSQSEYPGDYLELPEKKTMTAAELQQFTSYQFDFTKPAAERNLTEQLLLERLIYVQQRDSFFYKLSKTYLATNRPDLFAVYYRGVDYTSHGYWQYYDPTGFTVSPADIRLFAGIIPAYYRYMDRILQDYLENYIAPETTLIILSDHGFGAAQGEYKITERPDLSGAHRRDGVIIMAGPLFPAGEQITAMTVYDVLPTIMATQGLPGIADLPGTVRNDVFQLAPNLQNISAPPGGLPFRQNTEDELPAEVSESIKRELRSLGYIN